MGYVIAAVVVLLLVAGFVTFFALNAARRSGGPGPSRPSEDGDPTDIAAPDPSPLGDTAEHSDATGQEGRAEGADADVRPRVGDPGPEAPESRSPRVGDSSP